MVVRIRLARFGRRHAPVYNIVVQHARTARNAKPIEVIGTYDPIPKVRGGGSERPVKDISLDQVRARYWLGVGAQPSEPMWRLLAMFGLIEPRFRPTQLAAKREELVKKHAEKKEADEKAAKSKLVEEVGGLRMPGLS